MIAMIAMNATEPQYPLETRHIRLTATKNAVPYVATRVMPSGFAICNSLICQIHKTWVSWDRLVLFSYHYPSHHIYKPDLLGPSEAAYY